jgi:hypothetical protein
MTLLTDNQFIQMRDSGKFSTTFKGVHTVFEYVGSIKKHISKNIDNVKNVGNLRLTMDNKKYYASLNAPRGNTDSSISNSPMISKYFNKINMPNKYNISICLEQ